MSDSVSFVSNQLNLNNLKFLSHFIIVDIIFADYINDDYTIIVVDDVDVV